MEQAPQAPPARTICPTAMTGIRRIDFILQTLSDSRIATTSIRAVIKLYINTEAGRGTASHSSLAAMMGISSAAITRVADNIEMLGYAIRRTNASDRRSILIQLTPLGREIAEWLENQVHQEEPTFQTDHSHSNPAPADDFSRTP